MPEIKKITLRLNMDVPEEKAAYEFLADRKPYRKIIMEAVNALRFKQSEEERQKMYLHEIQIAVEKCFQNVQEWLFTMPQIISQPDDAVVQQSEEVEEGIDEFLESFSL
mgnify:FL=1